MAYTSGNDRKQELENRLHGLLDRRVQAEYLPAYDPKGYPEVRALYLQGEPYHGKTTRAFGYIGYPALPAGERAPAVVLVHGGEGYAFPEWVKRWNERGYAALALCHTGYRPIHAGITAFEDEACWMRREDDAQGGSGPANDRMEHADEDLEEQWMYHAVSLTFLAHNLLREDCRIDPQQIGLHGISWGGVIGSLAIGYDPRYAFAVLVYGSGYLGESLGWIKKHFSSPPVRKLWLAEERLRDVAIPVLWLCWANDPCFSIHSNSLSCADTPRGELSIRLDMGHSHPCGWNPPEIYRFADCVVRNGPPLIRCAAEPPAMPRGHWDCPIVCPADLAPSARLVYITEPMSYSADGVLDWEGCDTIDQIWQYRECAIEGNMVRVDFPEDAAAYYVELTGSVGGQSFVTSTRYVEIGTVK